MQRDEACAFRPADHIDPEYGRLLREAVAAGVEILSYKTNTTEEETVLAESLPVILDQPQPEAAETAPAELQDTYVRLDQTLGAFSTKVLLRYGKERVVFVVSSTGYDASAYSPTISAGTFSIPKASLLLNMYLSAKFGQAQYVEATFGRQIFIDHKAVEQHQLQLNDILAESEAFLTQMEGVADVYSARSLAVGPRTPELTLVRNSWAPGRSGDIIVEVNSGWTVEQADGQKLAQRGQAYMAAPLFLLGSQYEPAHISSHVESTAIAPTIARCLRIRAPSASRTAPLQ